MWRQGKPLATTTEPPAMTSTIAQIESIRRAGLVNVKVVDSTVWVFGCDYMIAARATRRGCSWEVTNTDAQEEIGGTFPSAIAAVRYALAQGPIA